MSGAMSGSAIAALSKNQLLVYPTLKWRSRCSDRNMLKIHSVCSDCPSAPLRRFSTTEAFRLLTQPRIVFAILLIRKQSKLHYERYDLAFSWMALAMWQPPCSSFRPSGNIWYSRPFQVPYASVTPGRTEKHKKTQFCIIVVISRGRTLQGRGLDVG